MSWDGFLPAGVTCKRCGAVLQGQGDGRPAESYLGTYNGLCYRCTGADGFVTKVERDGAQVWSYPPANPSWRRDREQHIGYADCDECKGSGFKWAYGQHGWRYRSGCEPCVRRYSDEPLRAAYYRRSKQIYTAANNRFAALVARLRKQLKLGKKAPLPEETLEEFRVPVLAAYRRAVARLERWAQHKEVFAARSGSKHTQEVIQ